MLPTPPKRRIRPGLVVACVVAALAGVSSAVLLRELFPQNPPAASVAAAPPARVVPEDVSAAAPTPAGRSNPQVARLVRGPEMSPLPAAARHAARAAREEKIVKPAVGSVAAPSRLAEPSTGYSPPPPPPSTSNYSAGNVTGNSPVRRSNPTAPVSTGHGPAQPGDPTDPNAAASQP